MALGLRQIQDFQRENSKLSRPGGKAFFKIPDVKARPALGSIQNTFTDRHHIAMKPKPSAFKPTFSTHIPTPAVQPAIPQVLPTLKEEPQYEKSLPSPESMDVGQITEAFSEQLLIEDIDSQDADNPQLCAEYAKDIYKYMKELECKFHVPPTYLEHQTDINERMRCILIDWLIQVHNRFKLLQETLYLTVSIIDRFLSRNRVEKCKLQLVGVTAMLIASKYEEMYAPEVRDFEYITDKAYSSAEIRAMEILMLKDMEYSLGNPLCLHFLRRNSRAGDATPEIHTMAKFLMELCLPEYSMLEYVPSQIAASALYLSLKLHKAGEWTATLQHYSSYSEADLLPCVRKIAHLVKNMFIAKQQAVKNKYSTGKFLKIAKEPSLLSNVIKELAASSQ